MLEIKLTKKHLLTFLALLIIPGGSLVLIGVCVHRLFKYKTRPDFTK